MECCSTAGCGDSLCTANRAAGPRLYLPSQGCPPPWLVLCFITCVPVCGCFNLYFLEMYPHLHSMQLFRVTRVARFCGFAWAASTALSPPAQCDPSAFQPHLLLPDSSACSLKFLTTIYSLHGARWRVCKAEVPLRLRAKRGDGSGYGARLLSLHSSCCLFSSCHRDMSR